MELNDALMVLGQIAFAEGDLAGAKHYLLESSDIMAEVKHIYRALPGAILSYVLRAQGDDTLARDCLIDALRSGIETHSISTIMYCLPAAALLAADDGQPLRTIEFYSLAQQFGHITHSLWFEAIACRELDGVLTTMPPKVSSATLARGRELDLWATADDLLRELTNH